jgi:hypothetical protein
LTTLPQDFADLLLELHASGAQFVVVGGYAVSFHGYPRATKDLDVLVMTGNENAALVYRALAAFGAPLSSFEVQESDFADYGGVLQIGVPPFRIDIITRADGVTFSEAIAAGERLMIGEAAIPVIGLDALIKNKRASGRPRDLDDAAVLTSLRNMRSSSRD